VNPRDELAGYVALQRLLDRRSALQRERDTPPDELVTLRTRFAERHEALADRQQRRDILQKEQPALQREVEALREEREHFRKQKSQVTNMKQLSAVVSELDHVESQLKAKEERLFVVWQELEALEKEVTELSAESPEERSVRELAEAEWDRRRLAADTELTAVRRSLKEARTQLGSSSWARFEKLWGIRKPNAVVPLDGTSCSACHAELRPALVQLVRAAASLETCESCRRLLYDGEQFPAP